MSLQSKRTCSVGTKNKLQRLLFHDAITGETPAAASTQGKKTEPQGKKTEPQAAIQQAIIHSDGGSRGNPGPAAWGYSITDGRGGVIFEAGKYTGKQTNNQAEYGGIIAALEKAKELRIPQVTCYLDSELIVKQLSGQYRVKHPQLLPLYTKVKELRSAFESATFRHVPRAQNKRADQLVNDALDAAMR